MIALCDAQPRSALGLADRPALIAEADAAGLFLLGLDPDDPSIKGDKS